MMSSMSEVVAPPVKTAAPAHANKNNHPVKNTNNNNSKRKNKHDRNGRKRSKSFSGCGIIMNHKPVLPTKFLLGGNINDPLNLNSLQDEEINRAMNAVTPKSSPIPTPPRRKGQIDVIIPANIHDPLSLIDCADDAEYEQQLSSPVKKGKKKRLKKRRTISTTSEGLDAEETETSAKTPENSSDSAKIPELPVVEDVKVETEVPPKPKDLSIELSPKASKKRKSEEHGHLAKKFKNSMDKIVSPVVPQPGAWLKRMNSCTRSDKPRHNKPLNVQLPLFKEKDKQFQYGNYSRYYGYRNPQKEDHRLKVFHHHRSMFEGKDILDIGCNIGHITLSVARDLGARSITGIDIDNKLIGVARKNIRHYVKKERSPRAEEGGAAPGAPPSVPQSQATAAPIERAAAGGASSFGEDAQRARGFPNNVTFKQCNYVLEDDALVALEQPQFDLILCLSITKWIHLNWGDAGIKQAFRRMYAQLRPGGKLILEPQNWSSYKSKKKLTPTIFNNYNSIEFFPEKFTEYLLSPAVGFAKSELLGFPIHQSKGFRRPLQVYTKSTMFPSERVEATPRNATPYVYDDSLYQNLMKTEKSESQSNVPVDSVEHVYTSILDRYCGCSEDNNKINDEIGESLNRLAEEGASSQNEKTEESKGSTPQSSQEIFMNGVCDNSQEATKPAEAPDDSEKMDDNT
ncbi:7SK snRNA methylphosphate capping enzyme bin3 isoform X2 [Aethina tumida]|uniref:7SK snRNA methylphosphate capping enzyme bin3 isoform X2 n=1 Tax=Aethina tumida TaxID=116153 RepID=UPI00096B5D40|nr:7SK snRNA methylphosphate capping enzyme bin3 isoform X2 [Aethina tumida]